MSVRRASLPVALLALGLLAPLAHAVEYTPVLKAQPYYLTCTGTTKEALVNEATGDPVPTWSAQAPASVTTGAGCGKADDGAFSGADFQTPYQFGFGGTVTGNLKDLTVTLYSARLSQGALDGADVDLDVRMTVDGISMFGNTQQAGATGDVFAIPAGRPVTVTPEAAGTGGELTAYTFTVKGLDLLGEDDAGEHTVAFDIADTELGATGWLWGAAESPTGVVANPDKAAGSALLADDRDVRESEL